MLLKFRRVKQDALLSLTKLLNWCLGRSLWYLSEDSLGPNLCGIQTNRVNIFLAVYIPDLNISKHVKLTFLHRSLQGLCRLWLPKNPAEVALPGRGSIPEDRQSSEQSARSRVSQLHRRGSSHSGRCSVCWFPQTGGRDALSLLFAAFPWTSAFSLLPIPEECQAPALRNLFPFLSFYCGRWSPGFFTFGFTYICYGKVDSSGEPTRVLADFLPLSLLLFCCVFSPEWMWLELS